MAKYLVTGGAGFIGSNIAEILVSKGQEVVVLDDLSTGREENMDSFRSGVTFIKGDIRDPETVSRALEGVDYVLHQAALASVPRSIENPVLVNDVNVNGTVNMLERSRLAGVKGFVYAASSSAYGDSEKLPKREEMIPKPLSPYAVSKLVGEHYCSVFSQVYGLPTVSLRYFNVFGPRQDPTSQYAAVVPIFISKLLEGERPTIYGDGEQSRDFTYVSNVVEANLLAASSADDTGQMVNIACGTRYTVNDLFMRIRTLIGSDMEPLYEAARPGDVKHSQADVERARDKLGFSCEVSFEVGLEKTVEWYRNCMTK
jgi:nucleoside-diphosphate-sugar epimerase